MKTPTPEQMVEYLTDPVKFCWLCWPQIKLYDKQQEVCYSVRDNVETYVHAGNELGKDFIASILVIWWFASRRPARVITTSSGQTQLESILWTEINQRIATSRMKLPFNVQHLHIRREMPDGQPPDELSYVKGYVTKTVENFQGHHLPHDIPRVLAVLDEASGIPDEFNDAADSWMHHKLVIGNPLNANNFFYRRCKLGSRESSVPGRKGLQQKVIHIGAEHSPNVQLGKLLHSKGKEAPYPIITPGVVSYEEFLSRSDPVTGWDSVKKTTRLNGHFYEGAENFLFPSEWLDCSEMAFRRFPEKPRKAIAMGVDGAEGRDLTCWTIIDERGVIKQYCWRTPNTMDIADKTIQFMRDFEIPPAKVMFDAGGGGKQITDYLRSRGYQVRATAFGAAPTPRRPPVWEEQRMDVKEKSDVYRNRRAEMYGMLRQLMNPHTNEHVFAIPPSEHGNELRQELAILPLQYDEGKLYLPPKDVRPGVKADELKVTLKKLLGRSPDRADSLVLAVFGWKSEPVLMLGAL